MSWMKITCWVELFNPKVFFWWFHELNIVSGVYKEKNPKLWWKFYGRVDKAAFYVSRTMFLEKINFSRSSFVCSFFDFQGRNSDFRKRFFSWLLKKYSTCPDDQFRKKNFFWNNSTILLLYHFWTLSGKNSTFGENYSAKFFKNAI